MTARWLAARGWRVSMLTWDEGQPDGEVIDGVRVFKVCRRDAGLWGLRFFHPRWTGLVCAMRRADADVYYQNCAEYVTGQVALWCRRNNRGFVYSVANDPDVDRSLPDMKACRERLLYRYGVHSAARVIVQTRKQAAMLRKGFGVESMMIPMPSIGPADAEYAPPPPPRELASCRILWIGRICEQKRPDRLLELAEACSDLRFDLVGPATDGAYASQIVRRARQIPNVTVHGSVPLEEVSTVYRQASCMCSTSDYEGFPNTFLEAWSHGLPIVSTFDPDSLIATRDLGAVAADVQGLAAALRGLLASPDRWRRASANARRYYLENHTVEAVLPRFEQVFIDAWNGTVRRFSRRQ